MEPRKHHELTPLRIAGLCAGIVVFGLIELLATDLPREARHAAALSATMIVWWFSEALPIHWTSLVPLVGFPLLAVLPPRDLERERSVCRAVLVFVGAREGALYEWLRVLDSYLDWNTFLFLGGMGIAAAMERWNLHKRLALTVLRTVGGSPQRLVLGFLIATAFVSLWISNTATAVMMTPIGIAVIKRLEEDVGRRLPHLGLAIMLSIAYASNVGGIGTKIGTAPNVIFCQSAELAGRPISFLEYLAIGLPFVLLFLPLVWWRLAVLAEREIGMRDSGSAGIQAQLAALGPMSRPERFIAAVFLLAAAAWIFGKPIASALGLKSSTPVDAATAMSAAALLFLVPLGGGRRALDLGACKRIPFSVLLLLGGSFAMADGLSASGFVAIVSEHMRAVADLPPLLAFLAVSTASVAVSAVASNTATTTLFMGMLASIFSGPLQIPVMASAAIAASCDFMLPAGTPPNAVVFGSGYVSVRQMVRTGLVLDLFAALLAGLWGYFGVTAIL